MATLDAKFAEAERMSLARDRVSAHGFCGRRPTKRAQVCTMHMRHGERWSWSGCMFFQALGHIYMNRCLVLSNDMLKCRHFSGSTFAQLHLLNCEPLTCWPYIYTCLYKPIRVCSVVRRRGVQTCGQFQPCLGALLACGKDRLRTVPHIVTSSLVSSTCNETRFG